MCRTAVGTLADDTGTVGDESYIMWDGARTSFRALVLCFHGDHLTANMWGPLTGGSAYDHVRALIQQGFMVVGIDAGGASAWANPSVVGSGGIIEVARTTLQSEYTFANSKVGVLGGSMGGLTALLYAKNNPTHVAGMEIFSPAVDLKWCYKYPGYIPPYSTGGVVAQSIFATEINAAYSCTSATFLTATTGSRPEEQQSAWNGLCPIKVIGANDDPTLPPLSFSNFVTGVGDPLVTLHELTTGGHMPFPSIDAAETIRFFDSLAWA